MTGSKNWETYEQVAAYLLNEIASELGLEYVEGKQRILGDTGIKWEIDGRGVRTGDGGFVVIECRRTKYKQKQAHMAALAYIIRDTGGVGGIMVTPIDVQKGAAKLADFENIQPIHMAENSTRTDYMLSFLNKVFVGSSDTIYVIEDARVEIIEDPKSSSVTGWHR